jgi:AcrR family transcriptional regulator
VRVRRAGFRDVELQAIADEVGVTRNLIHHYFPGGKHELYVGAVQLACSELVALLDVSAAVPLAEKMPANVRAYIDEIVAASPRFELYARALRSADDAVRAVAVAAREQIAAGIARNHLGTSRPPKPVRAAVAGCIAFTETTGEQWRDLGLDDRDRLERLVIEMLVMTIAAARGDERARAAARSAADASEAASGAGCRRWCCGDLIRPAAECSRHGPGRIRPG